MGDAAYLAGMDRATHESTSFMMVGIKPKYGFQVCKNDTGVPRTVSLEWIWGHSLDGSRP